MMPLLSFVVSQVSSESLVVLTVLLVVADLSINLVKKYIPVLINTQIGEPVNFVSVVFSNSGVLIGWK